MKLRLNHPGVVQIAKSPEMKKIVEARAQKIANAANNMGRHQDDYRASSMIVGDRYQANVYTATAYAKRHNAKHQTLLRALAGEKQ